MGDGRIGGVRGHVESNYPADGRSAFIGLRPDPPWRPFSEVMESYAHCARKLLNSTDQVKFGGASNKRMRTPPAHRRGGSSCSPFRETAGHRRLSRPQTARIDTLIEKQQRLIEMLRERRLAAITDSVVNALERNRAPRDSIWYPTLPAGWGFGRVKSIATRVTDGAHISPDTDGGVFDFVSTRDLHAGSMRLSARR